MRSVWGSRLRSCTAIRGAGRRLASQAPAAQPAFRSNRCAKVGFLRTRSERRSATLAAMCGIVGYVGARPALGIVVDGLRRLEYRGYDSAGVAVIGDGDAGDLQARRQARPTSSRRWRRAAADDGHRPRARPASGTPAGRPTAARPTATPTRTARPRPGRRHPQRHHRELRHSCAPSWRRAGVEFASDTDTECAAHLLELELPRLRRRGRQPDARPRSWPRRCAGCAGGSRARSPCSRSTRTPRTWSSARAATRRSWSAGATGENFLASDVSAFIEHTREAVELGQDQVVLITADAIEITDFDGKPAEGKDFHVDWDASAAEKGGYDYFMLKEIAEQPRAVADTLRGRLERAPASSMLDEMRLTDQDLRDVDKIFIVACGTAYHAGLVAKYAIEHWTRIPCEVELASEFRYRDPVLDRSTLVVAISQSGETMDTLMALRHAKDAEGPGAGDLQHQRLHHPARVRRRALHPRRARDRGRLDQGVPDPARRLLPGRPAPGPGPRHQVRRRGGRRARPAAGDAGRGRAGAGDHGAGPGAGPRAGPSRARCCSSGGTSATRWRWRAR